LQSGPLPLRFLTGTVYLFYFYLAKLIKIITGLAIGAPTPISPVRLEAYSFSTGFPFSQRVLFENMGEPFQA